MVWQNTSSGNDYFLQDLFYSGRIGSSIWDGYFLRWYVFCSAFMYVVSISLWPLFVNYQIKTLFSLWVMKKIMMGLLLWKRTKFLVHTFTQFRPSPMLIQGLSLHAGSIVSSKLISWEDLCRKPFMKCCRLFLLLKSVDKLLKGILVLLTYRYGVYPHFDWHSINLELLYLLLLYINTAEQSFRVYTYLNF